MSSFARAALAVLGGAVGSAQSAFPRTNGMIVFTSTRDAAFPSSPAEYRHSPGDEGGRSRRRRRRPENPAWSPDGSKIEFSRAGGIEVYDVANGNLQSLNEYPAFQPAWSPDGSMIAFTRFESSSRNSLTSDSQRSCTKRTRGAVATSRWKRSGPSHRRLAGALLVPVTLTEQSVGRAYARARTAAP